MKGIKGKYIFRVPNLYANSSQYEKIYFDKGTKPWHHAPYRSTGIHIVEKKALELKKLLIKQKVKFSWKETKRLEDNFITIRFKI